MLDIKEERHSDDPKAHKGTANIVHSGHFMISRVHEPNNDDDGVETVPPFINHSARSGYNFNNATKEISTTYKFGDAAIDESLTKLFECMTLAYSGTITSPRWKQFRGLHVSQKQRIRLNNLIWREWHMQYIYQKNPMVCQFATPLSDDIHSKPEAVVLEGKYWKRRLDTVTAEYKKWRRYYKDQAQRLRFLQGIGGSAWHDTRDLSEWQLLERVKDVTYIPCLGSGVKGEAGGMITQGQSNTDLALLQTEMMEMDFSNDLFNSFNSAPFPFPNPRELNQLGRSDLIQPGLVQLQPNLEEFMDIDSWQEMLKMGPSGSSSIGSSFLADTPSNIDMTQGGDTLLEFLTNVPVVQTAGVHANSQMAGSVSMPVTQQQQQQPQPPQLPPQQVMSPLTQLISAPNDSPMDNQMVVFQSMTSVDNDSGKGEQPQLSQCELASTPTIFVGSSGEGTHAQAYSLVTCGMNTNVNNSNNVNMAMMNTLCQKVVGDTNNSAAGATSTELIMQMLQQEAQKRQLQQQQRQLQEQRVNQQRQQQHRVKSPFIAPKIPFQQPTRQQFQQISQQQHQQQHFQQSPSEQSPLLAQSLTISSPSFPRINPATFGVPVSAQRTSHAVCASPTASLQGHDQDSTTVRKGRRQGKAPIKQQTSASGRRDSGGSGTSGAVSDLAKKKDGPFIVPAAKPVNGPRKNRTIAPAPAIAPFVPPIPHQQQQPSSSCPPSSSTSHDSYLEKLLKSGTYQGAMINMKKESSQQHSISGLVKDNPIQTTTNLYQQLRAARPSPSSGNVLDQMKPQQGPDLVTISAAGNHIQNSLSVLTAASYPGLDLNSISQQSIGNMVLPVSLSSQLEAMTTIRGLGEGQSQSQASSFSQLAEEKVPSVPSSPRTPVASPPSFSLKASQSSPQPSMDMSGSLAEPISPFNLVEMSPSSVGDPTSPGSADTDLMPDSRRAAHLSAEQKRRWNLKTGFDMLQQLVPSLSQNPRVSKATMLQKTAEFCRKLKAERLQMQKEAAILKREIESLNSTISAVQAQLPETGVPMTRQRKDQMREMLDDYVRRRTKENWKFWIFSVIMNSLYDSYCSAVSTASMEELCKTSLTWLDQSCSLVTLRPNVLTALTKLCHSTSVLTEPQRVKEQALKAVDKPPEKHK
ncbi:carbohydrate-responsive element-binding protein-like [Plakobranchus ocellatus]|uniref:Carbohydrate-responsive element-binding protein-like n=1 Tax=Plakobranchus ocellatus TaxID=259542 RepID=A0AAV4AV29_9GAST|nr:carbohydrate-responsive element-binding protein-like [Plakobranchus ocellatus]